MNKAQAAPTDRKIFTGAITTAVINGLINGAIQLVLLKDHAPLPLSVNGITNETRTVLGEAVPLAVTLAMILTVVAYLTLKAPKRPFLPSGLWLTLKHGIFAFGAVVAGAIVWQRVMGSVEASLLMAVMVMCVIAGVIAGAINYMTIRASLLDNGPDQAPVTANAN